MRRRLPALALLALALIVVAPVPRAAAAAAPKPGIDWPTLSTGNRGADVRTLQAFLRARQFPVPEDGMFGSLTRWSVFAVQFGAGLPLTGIVDGRTWERLVVRIAPRMRGEAIAALQRQLNEKRGAGLPVTGVYDGATMLAVRSFAAHVKLRDDLVVDAGDWRRLLGHFDVPTFSARALCDYSVGNGKANWGTAAAVGQLEAAAAEVVAAGYGRVAVGDIGREHGGDIPGHETHEQGLDVDVRPMRARRDQCTRPSTYRVAGYDRAATRALVEAIRRTAPGHVKLIYFNDPVLVRQGLTTHFPGHDNHLHIRYCDPGHALPEYRC